MTDSTIQIADSLLLFCISLSLIYLFVFAVAAYIKRRSSYPKAEKNHRYIVLTPLNTSFTPQQYPETLYDIIVYNDLFQTIQELDETKYDMVVILGETNHVSPKLLTKINQVFDADVKAIQLHRFIENRQTTRQKLHAIQEEINNSLFKSGATQLGLSSSLIGSDMALDMKWLKKNLKTSKSNLERKLLKQNIYIEYIESTSIYSKTNRKYAYHVSLRKTLPELPMAILSGNWSLCNKIVQQILPSALALCLITAIWALFLTIYDWTFSLKWWVILFGLTFTLCLAIPDYLVEEKKKKKAKIQ